MAVLEIRRSRAVTTRSRNSNAVHRPSACITFDEGGRMRIAIFFATREGHTRRIAEHLAAKLLEQGVHADLFDVRAQATPEDWTRYTTAVVAASVHLGKHEPEMIAFVTRHKAQLEAAHATFLSVSLSERGVEDPALPETRRRQHADDVNRMIEKFVTDTGWRPSRVLPVAGALAYRRYNVLVRFVMKRLAAQAGAPTDTSRNHDLTEWRTLDRFAEELVS
jgi:menaquinone-dependent protoporphyrinogen oxidase